MKVGGKSSNNTAVPFSVDNNGRLNTNHIWEGNMTRVINEAPRSTDAIISDVVDVSKYALVSLRVVNSTDQNVTLRFYTDIVDSAVSSTQYIADKDFQDIGVTIGHGSRSVVLTPDDLQCLSYLNQIKIRASFATAPTTGNLRVYISVKR